MDRLNRVVPVGGNSTPAPSATLFKNVLGDRFRIFPGSPRTRLYAPVHQCQWNLEKRIGSLVFEIVGRKCEARPVAEAGRFCDTQSRVVSETRVRDGLKKSFMLGKTQPVLAD